MERYVELDSHARSCTLGVMSGGGQRLKSLVVETNGRALVEAVRGMSGRVHLCLEEGTQRARLYELLKPHVAEVVVTMAPEKKGPKDDRRDAWARANELRTGAIETRVFKAPEHLAGLRNAVRAYGFAVTDVVRAKNRLKSVFLSRGIGTDASIYDATKRTAWLKELSSPHRELAEWLGRQLDQLEPLREEAERRLLAEAKKHPIIRKLSTAPGMGPIRTAQVVAIVATPERFRTRRQSWSYSGLGIVTRSSADWVQDKTGKWVRAQQDHACRTHRRSLSGGCCGRLGLRQTPDLRAGRRDAPRTGPCRGHLVGATEPPNKRMKVTTPGQRRRFVLTRGVRQARRR
jgi:transposase